MPPRLPHALNSSVASAEPFEGKLVTPHVSSASAAARTLVVRYQFLWVAD